MEFYSYTRRLKLTLSKIVDKMMDLIDCSTIKRFRNDPDSDFYLVAPEYYWGEIDEPQKLLQIELIKMYLSWVEHFKLLFLNSPASMLQEIKDTDKFINSWIEKESSWSIPRTKEEAKNVFKENVKPLFTLLDMLERQGCDDWIVIPDTNAILTCPEIERYSEVISNKDYSVIFTPTVLAELDELKVKSRDNDFREKVKSVINRIKGWRNQGSLLNGVTVHKTVTVRMLAKEPDFTNNLRWLESTNSDDRIIASVLEIQREFPSSIICLMTSDINLQNKAEMANIPFVEPPESRV